MATWPIIGLPFGMYIVLAVAGTLTLLVTGIQIFNIAQGDPDHGVDIILQVTGVLF